MTQITVIIPTYNRYDCMKSFIENCYLPYTGSTFVFEIHDSSSGDDTEQLIRGINADNLRYFRYPSEIVGDTKTMQALSNATGEYVYLLGDGLLIDFNRMETWLQEKDFFRYSILGIRAYDDLNGAIQKQFGKNELNSYDDHIKYFRDCFWLLTLYGASIVKRTLLQEAISEVEKYASIESPFRYICSLFEGLNLQKGECAVALTDFVAANPLKQDSGWFLSKRTVEFFCYRYYESMKLLPACYGATEREFLVQHNRLSGLFGFKSILKLRATGNLTWKIVKKYKFYMKQTVARMSSVYFALCIPKFVWSACYKVFKFLKRG